eukprot:CAMPEP_0198590034 /NCGR_PEP_ID=MMETSP1462-20131121/135152_1 /TAXON_ID=1333877 /ORGANISM="Brandtodinium nutriculum, Strain RCC3387" /LENGTH=71 /DNA_ID=CAMNT_0044321567 /DNA_START=164 /DNA_END=375 /DNA_ORIENTATION=-
MGVQNTFFTGTPGLTRGLCGSAFPVASFALPLPFPSGAPLAAPLGPGGPFAGGWPFAGCGPLPFFGAACGT